MQRWLNEHIPYDATKNIQTGFGYHFAAGRWHHLGNIERINEGSL